MMTEIYVVLEGGLCSRVYCNVNANVEVIDIDKHYEDYDAMKARLEAIEARDDLKDLI
jgi:hypothetical protein